MRVAACAHYFFVTGALAFFFETRAQPPDQGMEPEEGFDQHVEGGKQVVAAADVTEFVGEDGFEFGAVEAVRDAGGKPEDRAENAEDAGLELGGGRDEGAGGHRARGLPIGASGGWQPPRRLPCGQPAPRVEFSAFGQRFGGMDGGGHAAPARPGVEQDGHEAAEPERQEQGGEKGGRGRGCGHGRNGILKRCEGLDNLLHYERDLGHRRGGNEPPSEASANGGQRGERKEKLDGRRQPQPVAGAGVVGSERQGQQRGDGREGRGLPQVVRREASERRCEFGCGHGVPQC